MLPLDPKLFLMLENAFLPFLLKTNKQKGLCFEFFLHVSLISPSPYLSPYVCISAGPTLLSSAPQPPALSSVMTLVMELGV